MDRLFSQAKKALDSTTQLIAENQTFRSMDIAGFRGIGHSASHSSSPPATTPHGSTTNPFHTHGLQAPTLNSSTSNPHLHASSPLMSAPHGSNIDYSSQSLPPTTTSQSSSIYPHSNQPSPVPTSYASTVNLPHEFSPTPATIPHNSAQYPPQTHSPTPTTIPHNSTQYSPQTYPSTSTKIPYNSTQYLSQTHPPPPIPHGSTIDSPSHSAQPTTPSYDYNMYASPPQFSPAPTLYPPVTNSYSCSEQPTTTYGSTILPPSNHSLASTPDGSTDPTSYPPQQNTTPHGPTNPTTYPPQSTTTHHGSTIDPPSHSAPPNTTPYNSIHSMPAQTLYSSSTNPPPQPSAYNQTSPTPVHSASHVDHHTPPEDISNPHAQSGLTFQQKLQAKKNQGNLDNQFMQAVVRDNAEQVESLLKQGADINALVPTESLGHRYGVTALYVAAYKNYNNILRILLRNHANVDAYSSYNHGTALSAAIAVGNVEACEELLGAGANPNLECAGGCPLLCTLNRDNTEIIELLVMAGADVNAKPKDTTNMPGDSILGTACLFIFTNVVKYLISVGARIEDLKDERQYNFAKRCMEM